MGTMNFSVPDDIKESFNQAFANENKSAVVARLLRDAVLQQQQKQQSDAAFKRILQRRQNAPQVSTQEILRLRDELRAEAEADVTSPVAQ